MVAPSVTFQKLFTGPLLKNHPDASATVAAELNEEKVPSLMKIPLLPQLSTSVEVLALGESRVACPAKPITPVMGTAWTDMVRAMAAAVADAVLKKLFFIGSFIFHSVEISVPN